MPSKKHKPEEIIGMHFGDLIQCRHGPMVVHRKKSLCALMVRWRYRFYKKG
ncbi:hypothetical protein [Pararhizobium gei]|uniref:hypothetical protein n=1 Tax=Pararhizobium gei TaxID=1395951 RepID=UPI0023DCE618|nr:hypothetical protein [Rhizobium gei]